MPSKDGDVTRRQLVKLTGAAGLAGLAGCSGDGGDGGTEAGGGTGGDGGTSTPTETSGDGGGGGKGKLRLGYSAAMTGEFSYLGTAMQPAVQMVVNEANDHGGINGRDIKMYTADTKAKPNAGLIAARQQLESNNVHGYVGHSSFTLVQVADRIKESGVPFISPCAGTTDYIPYGPPRMLRTWPPDNRGGVAGGLQARYKKYNGLQDHERIGLISCKTSNCRSLIEPIRSTFVAEGGTHAKTVEVSRSKGSYSSEVSTLLDSNPDVIYLLTGPENSRTILRAAFDQGYEGNFAGQTELANENFRKKAPEKLTENLMVYRATQPGFVTDERMSKIKERYKQVSGGKEPGICWDGAFDAANVMTLAMKAAAVRDGKVTRDTISNHLTDVAKPEGQKAFSYTEGADLLEDGQDIDFQGVLTSCDFNQNGEVTSPYQTYLIKGGELASQATIGEDEIEALL